MNLFLNSLFRFSHGIEIEKNNEKYLIENNF